jgi:glycolate oxidase iron-sulfur subunit
MDPKTLVDYAASLDCIHCGLCLNTCPTYRLTGAESSSPRGRIHLMRAVAEASLEPDATFAEEMDFCLLCRHCESVCPSGVHFGAMMEHTRDAIEGVRARTPMSRALRWLGFRVLLPHRALLRLTATFARAAQSTGLVRLAAAIGGSAARGLLNAPSIPPRSERRRLPGRTRAIEPQLGTAFVLEGCVMPELFGRVNRATVDVLARCGFECLSPSAQTCCGSLHAHNGDLEGARALARRTIAAFDERDRAAPIVVNSAGCSAHMKEYGHLLRDDASWREPAGRFSARVVDFSEFVASKSCAVGLARALAGAQADPALSPVAYDDPCHLCHGQQIRGEPRTLLDRVTGLARVEMKDSELCCGSAGIYALARPLDSAAVFESKLAAFTASGAKTLVTANPGCQMQWQSGFERAGVDARVMHVAEVLDEAMKR